MGLVKNELYKDEKPPALAAQGAFYFFNQLAVLSRKGICTTNNFKDFIGNRRLTRLIVFQL